MELLCKFGTIRVLFKGFPCHSLWPFWSWKLDPFKIQNGEPDIVVDYDPNLQENNGTPIWEDGGNICRQFFSLDDGRILWQQTENSTKQLQLQFLVSADWSRITLTYDKTPTSGAGAFEALTFLIYYAFSQKQVLSAMRRFRHWKNYPRPTLA